MIFVLKKQSNSLCQPTKKLTEFSASSGSSSALKDVELVDWALTLASDICSDLLFIFLL